MHESEELIREVLSAGVRGYLLKSDATRQLIPAVESVSRHMPYFSGRVSAVVLDGFLKGRPAQPVPLGAERLTSREREIVQLLAEGNSNKAIATRLDLSVKTVETHRASVMRKLDLNSLADIVRWLLSASGVVGLSHATRPATRALSRALPRRRALCTNWKNPR